MKFLKFISNNYDLNDEKIKHKLKHTFHVVTNAKYLCDEMNIDSNNKEIALLIALLHDMGRFDQAKVLKNFREDINNYDHATLGVKLLFENNLIREFVKEAVNFNRRAIPIGTNRRVVNARTRME